ncbi:MAG: serpin family protein [Chloroflexota bacterium]
MKKGIHILCVTMVVFSLVLSACGPEVEAIDASSLPRVSDPDADPGEVQALVAGNSAFAFDLYQALRATDTNLFYSPYSISLALAMTYAGARGETADQMAATLHLNLPDEDLHQAFNALDTDLASRPEQAVDVDEDQRFQLNIVNAIWGQQGYPFLEEFLDLLALNYGAGLRLADFVNAHEAARGEINDWVSRETNQRIEDLLAEGVLDPATVMVLVNAIYFKAAWQYPFSEPATRPQPFTLLDGTRVDVPMMSFSEPAQLDYRSGDGYQTVSLPYMGGLAEMVVLLPDEGSFPAFEASLTAERLVEILAGMETRSVALSLPKFEFTNDFNLDEKLPDMGMRDAFDAGLADFSGMDGNRLLFISAVIHKAFVSVDEEGTEAAAATAVVMTRSAMILADVELTVDRPFIFIIRDIPTGTILFIGRVLNPVE